MEKTTLDSTDEFRIIYNVGKKSGTGGGTVNPSVEYNVDATLHQPQTSSDSILVPITDKGSTAGDWIGGTPASYAHDLPPANSINSDDDSSNDIDVTLISASDFTNTRRYLISLVERWKGPISLTIFAHSAAEVESVMQFMSTLRTCHALVKQFVTYHLVFPAHEKIPDLNPRKDSERLLSEQNFVQNLMPMMCQNFYKNLMPFVHEQVKLDPGVENKNSQRKNVFRKFPINLLRNVGRLTVTTKYSFVIDIDLLPSNGLRAQFQEFIKSRRDVGRRRWRRAKGTDQPQPPQSAPAEQEYETKVVFVAPAFETKNGEIPSTKAELLTLLESYQARPYYFDLCWKSQVHTDYESWQRESPSSRNELSILFEVLWKDPWEPFFISDNHYTPAYDERFQTEFGYHRLSQLCELHMNGYKFAVLNDAFLIHPNFKTLESGTGAWAGAGSSTAAVRPLENQDPDDRAHNFEVNRQHFVQFKNEMSQKYPQSTRRCY